MAGLDALLQHPSHYEGPVCVAPRFWYGAHRVLGLSLPSQSTTSLKEEPVVDILRTLKPHEQKSLAGNGMNLITQGAFMAFVLANVQKKRHMVAQLESELFPEHDLDL